MNAQSSVDAIDSLRERLRCFVAERDWSRFHDPKNLAMALASEAGELLAELRWVSSAESDEFVGRAENRASIEREIGDITIALLLFCERAGIDVLSAAARKLELNSANYPVALSKGRAERPPASVVGSRFSRAIAVDWSGVASGGHETIWIAEVADGAITALENGRSREGVIARLIAIAADDPNVVIGLDFAFALPKWFGEERGLKRIDELWSLVAYDGERWLRECEAPFWGRPGTTKPTLSAHFRQTDLKEGRSLGGQAKSVFQIGGAGAVGTGSLRGMPHLARLRKAGFSIWPFDPPGRPLVVEIYPRVLTGPVVKSDLDARFKYLSERFPALQPELRERAASTEDAFDAAVSALAMWEHRGHLESLQAIADEATLMEGQIWVPILASDSRPND